MLRPQMKDLISHGEDDRRRSRGSSARLSSSRPSAPNDSNPTTAIEPYADPSDAFSAQERPGILELLSDIISLWSSREPRSGS